MSFRHSLNYWILKWLRVSSSPFPSHTPSFHVSFRILLFINLWWLSCLYLKVLNVEFKALHVVTPVHHSRLNLRKKKKRLNLPTLHFSSYWIVHIFSYNTAKLIHSDSYSAFLCVSYYFKAPRNIPSVVSDHPGDDPLSLVSNHLLEDISDFTCFYIL